MLTLPSMVAAELQGQPGSNGLLVVHSCMQIITFCMRHADGRRFEPGEPNGGSASVLPDLPCHSA
jgi:hypothetical protein